MKQRAFNLLSIFRRLHDAVVIGIVPAGWRLWLGVVAHFTLAFNAE